MICLLFWYWSFKWFIVGPEIILLEKRNLQSKFWGGKKRSNYLNVVLFNDASTESRSSRLSEWCCTRWFLLVCGSLSSRGGGWAGRRTPSFRTRAPSHLFGRKGEEGWAHFLLIMHYPSGVCSLTGKADNGVREKLPGHHLHTDRKPTCAEAHPPPPRMKEGRLRLPATEASLSFSSEHHG